jgi:hypothetical protein
MMVTLAETTPRLWQEKTDYIRHHQGLALVNAHPDYLRDPRHFAIYEAFLKVMSERDDYWHALPRDVARWWRARAELRISQGRIEERLPPEAKFDFRLGDMRLSDTGGVIL